MNKRERKYIQKKRQQKIFNKMMPIVRQYNLATGFSKIFSSKNYNQT